MSTMSTLDSFNPSLTRYDRNDPAPVLPLREEPDLLSWLETSGRLVADEIEQIVAVLVEPRAQLVELRAGAEPR